MEEIDLDFLKTPAWENDHPEGANSSFVFNEFDFKFGKKKNRSKRFEMPQTIAKVDELVQEIDKLKSQNVQLQQQLKGFQVIAHQVEELYTKEKEEHNRSKFNLDKLQKDYHTIDVDLTNMSMLNGQLNARLADYDGRPINFDNLAVKYVKIINKLEGHDIFKHCLDKDLVEKLREYCAVMKLKIPRTNSPQKSKSRRNKVKSEEAAVQCDLLVESCKTKPKVENRYTQCSSAKRDQASQYNNTMSAKCDLLMENSLAKHDCPSCKTKPKVKDQNTQCFTTKRDQASQYISTMITRQTNTDKTVQKSVQTMFPEAAAIDDILKVYSRWSNIRSISPLLSPSRICSKPSKEVSKKCSTTGTCTMLCNIRRRIDYMPPNNASNIKQETFTPSVSPTPISYPITSRSRMGSLPSNVSGNTNSSLLNLFNSNTNSSLDHLSSNAFNELWHIFGKMLLSLLQSSNAGIANTTTQNSPLNQQQFLDWLLELYRSSQPQNTPTLQTQTLEQRDINISTSPLFFNDASTLPANVVRPQPQKTLQEENVAGTNVREIESNISSSNSIDNSNSNSQIPIDDHSKDFDSINGEVQQIQITSNTNDLPTTNTCKSNLYKLPQKNSPAEQAKSIKSPKNKNKILEKIQELLPEINLNKKKRKALRRLLKSKNHHKKSFETKKNKDHNKKSSVVILTNENYNDDTIETAVDFLKTFAVTEQNSQPLEENFSETEKIFLKQISNENLTNNVSNILTSEQFHFMKPSSSLAHTQTDSKANGDISKCSKSKSSQKIEKKYQLLFGESPSEFEDQEMERENSKFKPKPVIKSTATLESGRNMCDLKIFSNSTKDKIENLNYSQDYSSLAVENSTDCDQLIFGQEKATESTNSSVEKNLKQIRHSTLTNTSHQQSLSPKIPTPIYSNSCNLNSSQETSIDDMPTVILNNLGYTYLPEAFDLKNAKNCDNFHLDANKQSIHPSTNTISYFSAKIESSVVNDLELSSDGYSDKDDENTTKINEVPETKAKFSKEVDIYNYIEQGQKKCETFENYDEKDKPTNEMCIKSEAFENYDEKDQPTNEICIKSVPNLNEDDSSNNNMISHQIIISPVSLVQPNKSMAEKSIESLPNLNDDGCPNDSMNSHQIIISTEPMHSSDFEKDLELSSDSESVISENDLNDLHNFYSRTIEEAKDNDLCGEIFNSISSTVSEKASKNVKSIELLELHQEDNKLNNFEESLMEKSSENRIEQESGSIFYESSGKEILKIFKKDTEPIDADFANSRKILNTFASTSSFELQNENIAIGVEQNLKTTLNTKSKQQKYLKINNEENDLNDLHKLYSRTIEEPKNNDFLGSHQQLDNKLNHYKESFKEKSSKNPIEQEKDSIFNETSRKEKEILKRFKDTEPTDGDLANSRKSLNNFGSTPSFEFQNKNTAIGGEENQQKCLKINNGENDLNDLRKLYSRRIEEPKDNDFCGEIFNITPIELLKSHQQQDNKHHFKESFKEICPKNPIEQEKGSIFYESSGKEKEILKYFKGSEQRDGDLTNSRVRLNSFASTSAIEFQNANLAAGGEESVSTILNCKSEHQKCLKINKDENDLNDLHKLYSRRIEESKDDFCGEIFNMKPIELLESHQQQDSKLNHFKECFKEKISKNPIEQEEGSIFYESSGKEKEILKDFKDTEQTEGDLINSRISLNSFASTTSIEVKNENIAIGGEESLTTILNCKSEHQKCLKINNGEDILESKFEDASPKNFKEQINKIQNYELNQKKDNLVNNCRGKLFQSNSIIESKGKGALIHNSKWPKESFIKTFQNFVMQKHLEGENAVSNGMTLMKFVPKSNLKRKKKDNAKNASKSCSVRFLKSHCSESESTNQSNSEENSAAWPLITVSDSTSYNEALNNNETSQTPNKKNSSENVVPKVSSLSTLKLLDINTIYNHQKLPCDSMTNTKTINEVIGIQDKLAKDEILKDENNINSFYDDEDVMTKARENINNIKMFEYPNTSKINRKERVVILSCSTITKPSHTNNFENFIKSSACQQDLNIPNKNTAEIAPTYINGLDMDHQNHLNELDKNGEQAKNRNLKNLELSYIDSFPNNVPNSRTSVYTVDESDLNDDNLSIENELMIDEEPNNDISKHSTVEHLNSSITTEFEEDCKNTTNSSNISSLLNSTLYNEVLTESINPIVNDLLKDELVTASITPEVKHKKGRKRKSECLAELKPCKRSQRIKAKQMILEESVHLSKTPIELGKYTNCGKIVKNNVLLKSTIKDEMEKKYFQPKSDAIHNSKLPKNENTLQLGFFRERMIEEDMTVKNNIFTATKTQDDPKAIDYKTFTISNEAKKAHIHEKQDPLYLEDEKTNTISPIDYEREQEKCNKETLKMNYEFENARKQTHQGQLEIKKHKNLTTIAAVEERENCTSQKDWEPLDNFVYSDSPQSPAPAQINNGVTSDTFVIIPLERPSHFMPQDNILTLFDVLIDTYKNENQKQVRESDTTKEFRRKESILNKFGEELKSYCYTEMELDLFCTSTSLINKLLSISPDYNLILKALITVAQNDKGTSINENDFPSIIQEVPPRHLSKCLQRLFIFLKNMVTRNNNLCHDLINKIESLLFNSKQIESLSLQATLNLTQLYLMASKVQEYLQISKHPARLFIAKCLYFYLQKSVLMIHEVLMWYPTVLPYREDKTYDRSDALISVIQQILMSNKYDMCKPELRGKVLLSKLRYEYHFEPFKPSAEEVINVLMEKLKNSKFYNISLAFGLLCKRMGVIKTQDIVLNQHLIPLANEYYILALKTNEYDKRIAVLLEVISMLIKPFPIDTDTQKYFSDFARFLNGFERQVIQEAALCSLLRLQRFNMEYCYNLLRHFHPTYNLNIHTQAMLKTFLYRRPLTFWKRLKLQNPKNFN